MIQLRRFSRVVIIGLCEDLSRVIVDEFAEKLHHIGNFQVHIAILDLRCKHKADQPIARHFKQWSDFRSIFVLKAVLWRRSY